MRIQSIKLNSKKFMSSVLVVGGLIFSVNVNAAEPTIESEVTAYMIEQSKQLIEVMTSELKQTIADEINSLSVASVLPWLEEEQMLVVKKTAQNQQVSKRDNQAIN